ncbi:hypothetical protein [uncultured Tateyamaria sp.]|uniref:hypothetical protein n=1 Tax=uncultured Tateyamaria sp. TaxID=455651 RepID=UPI00261A7C1D|nr:hypothetical protein [uncultured Tateyamaria sp.]
MNELSPGFRPRWVRTRKWALIASLGFQLAFVFFLNGHMPLLAATSLSLACLSGWYWVHPKYYSALVGMLLRRFPELALKHAKLESWLEFDLDWDERRQ